MTCETSKRVSFPDLLNFSQFYRHNFKTRTMLFPTTFISASEKIGVGLEKKNKKKTKKKKQVAILFLFHFTRRRVVRYSCFDFSPVQNEGIFGYLGYEILI